MRVRSAVCFAIAAVGVMTLPSVALGASAGPNVRVTVDNGAQGPYESADQLSGGTYTDTVLQRCGMDRRLSRAARPSLGTQFMGPLYYPQAVFDRDLHVARTRPC